MNLEKGMYQSGFDTLLSLLTGMRGPLDNPGKGKWYQHLYTAFVFYMEFAMFGNWLTILLRFLTPGLPVEERCFTGFPTGTMSLAIIRRLDMYFKRSRYRKLMEEYMSLYGDAPQLIADVEHYAKVIRNIPRVLLFFNSVPMATIDIMPAFVALAGGVRALCVPSVYPFDPAENLWVFCYLCSFQSTTAFCSTLRLILYENTFNMFACRQLALTKHLSRELARILKSAHVDNYGYATFETEKGELVTQEQARENTLRELKQWIINHQRSMRLAKELQDMYTIPLFVQYAFTGIVLCTNAFVVANVVGGYVNVFFCGLYVFGMLIELLITCRIGELILYESNNLERVIDGTHMYSLPGEVYKRWVRMILTRGNVPLRLSALGVFPLDIETYKSIKINDYFSDNRPVLDGNVQGSVFSQLLSDFYLHISRNRDTQLSFELLSTIFSNNARFILTTYSFFTLLKSIE